MVANPDVDVSEVSVGPLDFLRPEHRADPYPSFAALRTHGPVMLPNIGMVIGDYATSSVVLRDARFSAERRRGRVFAQMIESGLMPDGGERDLAQTLFLFRDPPDHTRLRGLVAKAFTRRVVADLEGRIAEITNTLLDRASERGGDLELVEDLAYPLPVAVICDLLGVPAADHAIFTSWSAQLASALDPTFGAPNAERLTASLEAGDEFRAYFRALSAQRRAAPRDDLLSGLVHAEADGARLSESELLATCILLLIAGHETTVSLIANGVRALVDDPDQWAALVAEPALVDSAVEETLRYDPPVQLTGRVVLDDMELAGQRVVPTDVVMVVLGATGRDGAMFSAPDHFDLRRTPEDGALRHLAFSAGIHFCLGAPLARLETAVALSTLSRRLQEPAFAAAPIYKDNLVLRGPASMPLTYTDLRPAAR